MDIITIILAIAGVVVGLAVGWLMGNKTATKNQIDYVAEAQQKAEQIIAQAKTDAEAENEKHISRGKEKYRKLRSDSERKLKELRNEAKNIERNNKQLANNLKQKEDNINKVQKQIADERNAFKTEVSQKENQLEKERKSLEQRKSALQKKEHTLAKDRTELDAIRANIENERRAALEGIANLTAEDAKKELIESITKEAEADALASVKNIIDEAKTRANKEAKKIIIQTIQRTAAEHTIENTVSVFNLQSDNQKGQIIGREGRNIRALEAATGVEIIVDDTPEAIVISGYDPVRREVCRLALHKLVIDGRIHPARIEEIVAKTRKELDQQIIETGERTVIDLNIHGMKPDMIRMVGRMRYRSSYGQNLLNHSIETAKICATMAAELGLSKKQIALAKRAGLLHDIGKVPDEETDLSHALLGMKLAERFGEVPAVVNAIGAHHDEIEMNYIISPIVQASDAISGARPGARREILESYLERLSELETLAMSYNGVEKAYAIQAGRELRVIVDASSVTDNESEVLSTQISTKIQKEMQYPGQIKVAVIREKRAISFAK